MLDQIDFYLLPQTNELARRIFVCRLLNQLQQKKILSSGKIILIRTKDLFESNQLDTLIWTWHKTSFIPHQIADTPCQDSPVVLSHASLNISVDITINCSDQLILEPKSRRLLEVLLLSGKASGRERYKRYQAFGIPKLKIHRL